MTTGRINQVASPCGTPDRPRSHDTGKARAAGESFSRVAEETARRRVGQLGGPSEGPRTEKHTPHPTEHAEPRAAAWARRTKKADRGTRGSRHPTQRRRGRGEGRVTTPTLPARVGRTGNRGDATRARAEPVPRASGGTQPKAADRTGAGRTPMDPNPRQLMRRHGCGRAAPRAHPRREGPGAPARTREGTSKGAESAPHRRAQETETLGRGGTIEVPAGSGDVSSSGADANIVMLPKGEQRRRTQRAGKGIGGPRLDRGDGTGTRAKPDAPVGHRGGASRRAP